MFGRAQQLFLEPGELGKSKGESGIIAKRTEIAQVIREALQFQRRCPQPGGSRRQVRSSHAFQGLAISPRKRDGRIAGDARRQPVAVEQRQLGESPFDALVNVSQTFLEPEYLFTDHRKTEMAGFDDPRVDGTHRNFMHAIAFHRYESVGVDYRNRGRRRPVDVDQWMKAFGPSGVTQPWPRIRVGGAQSGKIRYGALHAPCTRKPLLDAGIVGIKRQRQPQYEHSRPCDKRGSDDVVADIIVACPQRQQPAPMGRHVFGGLAPFIARHGETPRLGRACNRSSRRPLGRLIEPPPENQFTLPRSSAPRRDTSQQGRAE